MATMNKWLTRASFVCLWALVLWNTWSIFQLNAAMTAVVEFLLRGLKIGN